MSDERPSDPRSAALVAARAAALAAARKGRPGPPAGRAAAAEAPPPEALPPDLAAFGQRVAARLPDLKTDGGTVGLPAFRVRRERLLEACALLCGDPEFRMDYLTCLSGVDYPERIEVVYHLFSIPHPGRGLVLKTAAPKAEPDGRPWVPSVTAVWAGANWHEREVFDLLGLEFRGHPDLRRILLPEGFDGGFPLRKDFVDQREQRERKVRAR